MDEVTSVVDLMPAVGPVIEAVIGAAALAIAAAAARLFAWVGLDKDAKFRAAAQEALDAAASYSKEEMLRRGKDIGKVEVRSEMTAIAAGYVVDTVPKALKHFKIDEDGLRQRINARIGLIDPPLKLEQIAGEPLSTDADASK